MAELLINGKDAWEEWGVRMGDGFIDAILTPAPPKEPITSTSRLEHGTRVIPGPNTGADGTPKRYLASRDLSLTFNIHADSEQSLSTRKKAFMNTMLAGYVIVTVPGIVDRGPYRLLWTGIGSTFGMSLRRTDCRIMLKFIEPDPTDHGPWGEQTGPPQQQGPPQTP